MWWRTLMVLIGFCIAGHHIYAQTYEEYVKQQKASLSKFKNDQQEGIKKMAEDLKDFRQKQNKEFSEYLKNNWRKYDVQKAEEKPPAPKPPVVPDYTPELREQEIPPGQITPKSSPIIQPEVRPVNIHPLIIPPRDIVLPQEGLQLPFYNQEVFVHCEGLFNTEPIPHADGKSIQAFWEAHAEKDMGPLIGQLWLYRQKMNINDWGYYLLIKSLAEKLAGEYGNTSRLISWAILNQSGYRARIGFANGKAFIMLAIQNTMYSLQYIDKDGIRYYLPDDRTNELSTYPEDFPAAKRSMDMNLYRVLNFENTGTIKKFTAPQGGDFSLTLPENTMAFYEDYPQSQLEVYFDAGMSRTVKEPLLDFLATKINDLNEQEKVSYLLTFVQKTFEYKTDDEQFGHEKWFFPDELFYYNFSDCEDRSVLFSWLVRKLTGLEVCALHYPGHAATAVAFTDDVSGDYVMLANRKFTVCDPTYINAPIGKAMPQFADVAPGIKVLRNLYSPVGIEEQLMEEMLAQGAYPANGQSCVHDNKGHLYLAGCYNGNISLFGVDLQADQSAPNVFIARFNIQGQLDWIKSAGGSGNDFVQGICITSEGNISVGGTYENAFKNGSHSLNHLGINAFIWELLPSGKTNSLVDIQLDQDWVAASTAFASENTAGASRAETQQYPADMRYPANGLQNMGENKQIMIASFANTPMSGTAASENEDFAPAMKSVSKQYLDTSPPESAWLLAFLNIIQQSGVAYNGIDVLNGIRELNPQFEHQYKWLFDAIEKVRFLKNENGLIEVQTENGNSINLSNMRLSNNTRFKVSMLNDNDARIDFYGGAKVGKAMFWYALNSIIIEHAHGDMVFDYDDDHTRKRINLKEDLL